MAPDSASLFGISQAALDECAREPIHIPGKIQPFGILLVLSADEWRIVQVSDNTQEYVGWEPTQLLEQPLTVLLGERQTELLRQQVAHLKDGIVHAQEVHIPKDHENVILQALLHLYQQCVYVELLPLIEEVTPLAQTLLRNPSSLTRFYDTSVRQHLFEPLEGEPDDDIAPSTSLSFYSETSMHQFCQFIVEQVQLLTRYDRVMLYQFDAEGNGEVIAEEHRSDLGSYLGLHYPASDIPPQARALYLRKRVRLLGNVYGQPVQLIPQINPRTQTDTDLSYCILRGFSPIHLQYLHNMGVQATMTVSIIREGQLWGLIACHHYQPYWISYELQIACDLLSEIISVQLSIYESYIRARAEAHAHRLNHRFMHMMVNQQNWVDALLHRNAELLCMIESSGIAIYTNGRLYLVGETPPDERIRALIDWLHSVNQEKVFHTHQLSTLNPAFLDISSCASGILQIELSQHQQASIIWFRGEFVHDIYWGGNPQKGLEMTPQGARLRPRASFEAWKTQVLHQSKPWSREEVLLAEAIRSSVVDILMEILSIKTIMTDLELLRIRKAVESASEPIAVANASGSLIFLNNAFVALYGYSQHELNALACFETLFVDPLIGKEQYMLLQQLSQSWTKEVDLITKTQELVRTQVQANPLRNEHDEIIGYVYLCTDLRERIRVEEERRKLDLQLQQTQKLESLGLLAGGIAHDFNNLLTSILGNASLALLDLPQPSPIHDSLRQIELAAQRAADLCRQMLAYSGKGKFVVQTIDVNELIGEMSSLLHTVISKGIELKLQLEEEEMLIQGDITQIRQVIMNLIINAADAIGQANGTIAVSTNLVTFDETMRQQLDLLNTNTLALGNYIKLQVADTGAGMSQATMNRIFDPFFTTKSTGRGLGLAAVQGIIRSHHGVIQVSSEEHVGTIFTVYLPSTTIAFEPPKHKKSPIEGFGVGYTVLVIDDDVNVRVFLRKVLERVGFRVLLAEHGIQGLEIFAAHQATISYVILDLMMPHMSGSETFNHLRAMSSTVPILISSGYSEQMVDEAFANHPIGYFLQKPYQIADLYEKIRVLLNT